jgi:cytochrome c biogenesis protein CcdA
MALFILSFIAGVLTVAAPCVLPLLPIIVGGSLTDQQDSDSQQNIIKPIIITASLAVSIIVFTLLLKATTALLGVSQMVWQALSGGLVILLGIHLLFPQIWETISLKLKLYARSNEALGKGLQKRGLGGAVVTGVALGPVFNSCSPTYALIVATVLPASFAKGLVYLIAYALGLGLVLLLIAFVGQTVVQKLGWLANPKGWFKKVLAIIFIVVGLLVMLGVDRKLQAFILEHGWYSPISKFEQKFQ